MQIKLQFEALKLYMTGENYTRLPIEVQKNGTHLRETHDIRDVIIKKRRKKKGWTAQMHIFGLIYIRL